MGSGSSNPIKEAESVEVDHHSNMVELRFDHTAVGGTAIIIIIFIIFICYCIHRNRARMGHHNHATHQPSYPLQPLPHHGCQMQQGLGPQQSSAGLQIPIVWHVRTEEVLRCAKAIRAVDHQKPASLQISEEEQGAEERKQKAWNQ